ncbi:MAG: hypothetical protein J7J71_06335 [Deltaproteobacteria bacterium]|nr:hypothetical protein [Candidatus Tharpella sp.]
MSMTAANLACQAWCRKFDNFFIFTRIRLVLLGLFLGVKTAILLLVAAVAASLEATAIILTGGMKSK